MCLSVVPEHTLGTPGPHQEAAPSITQSPGLCPTSPQELWSSRRCKWFGVPVEKIYSKIQRERFAWALDTASEDFEF
ncbi:DNA topoisomerase I, mitochondrial [Pteropus alecto]|uniref:DNA topoisomerase I, mitochondrial n=1 Tax=Pteropus alecto TaxID=9402 RepID=L5KJ61_PTEAL|nr:DNA topoisomerase I, mitochondrial [Pteropus alecto]